TDRGLRLDKSVTAQKPTRQLSVLGWREIERNAVHAEPETRRRRAVGKDVAEVAATARTVHLDAFHEKTVVRRCLDGAPDRRPKARPAGAALELGRRFEQRLTAGRADERACSLFKIERAGPWALGTVLAQHAKLLRCQRLAPLFVALLNHVDRTVACPHE